MSQPPAQPGAAHPVNEIVEALDALTGAETVRLRDMLEAFGQTGFVPMLVVPALLVVSPLSGIPLFSSICGLTIALVALQMLGGRDRLWLPEAILNRRISGNRVHRALAPMRRLAGWLDSHSRNRLRLLTQPPLDRVQHLLCALCGLSMPLLEMMPFSSSLLGGAVLFFSTALLTRDGVFMVPGLALMGIAATVPLMIVSAVQ